MLFGSFLFFENELSHRLYKLINQFTLQFSIIFLLTENLNKRSLLISIKIL